MADLQFTMTLNGLSGDKRAVAVSATVSPPAAGQIQLIVKDTVDIYLRLQIGNLWRYLYNGLSERQIIETFFGNIVYSSIPVISAGSVDRKTSSDAAIMLDGDVAISLAADLVTKKGDNLMLENAFTQLRDFARERVSWVA